MSLIMNRRKKIVTKFQKKDKRTNAKLYKTNKPTYVSKAEREKLALQAEQESQQIDDDPKLEQ